MGDSSAYNLLNGNYSYQTTHSLTFQLKTGLNKITLGFSLFIQKGQMIMINTSMANLLAVKRENDFLYPDFYLNGTKLFQLSWKFYFSCLIDQKFYISVHEYTQTFIHDQQFKEYNITTNFIDSSLWLSRKFIVSNCKFQ